MGFLPKDYVGVDTRIEKAHEKHGDKLSIHTEFDIKDRTVIFTARVTFGDQTFTGHSFGEVGKEKAFEKLETVAVGRALAFAGFETRSGIASREEMEVWNEKNTPKKELVEYIEEIRAETDTNVIVTLAKEALELFKSEKQQDWIKREARQRTDYLNESVIDKVIPD